MAEAFLKVQDLARRYPGGKRGDAVFTVFEQVNFSIRKGEFVCMIGHSGCGKTTILNVLAGLDRASDGVCIMDGREIAGPSLDRGVIFQNHSLLPWHSALKNVTFAVAARHRDWNRRQVLEHSQKYLERVGLRGSEARRPAQLSGGMRQRVGIARAFAIEPKLLLMDEPFGALDALTRGNIQEELIRIWSKTHQTVFMITHDVDEAILLADRILLMTNGPEARIAESVVVDLPRPRDRTQIIHLPAYYAIRNHLIEFLVRRSKDFLRHPPAGFDPRNPPTVQPGLETAVFTAPGPSSPRAHRSAP
ncbi:MAG: ABC transporter ATP-binding protein [Nevskiales bacterium]|nr:ABC transporter ATP-binding protein [Nevskiales bacterium]